MKKLSVDVKKYEVAPLNKQSPVPMLYMVDIIGWDKESPIQISESEKEAITEALAQGSFIEIGDVLVNPTSIRFIKAIGVDSREKFKYTKLEQDDGSTKIIKEAIL